MKKQILYLSLITIAFSIVLTSCKKDNNDNGNSDTEITATSNDQSRFQTETDAISADVNIVLESEPSFTGRTSQVQTLICNADVVVDTMSNPRTITITYNGVNCFGTVSRSGIVTIAMAQGVRWKDAGAVISVNYQSLQLTRLLDNKSITINGEMNFTNESGGLLVMLPSLGTITHSISSTGMSVKFDDNSVRTWQIGKQRDFTYDNGIVITTRGTHTENDVSTIAEWGVNRFGNPFSSATTQPLVVRQDCNFRLVSGEVTHKTANVTAVATFGLDASGNPTTCPGGSFYFKLVFTGPNGNSITSIWPY